MKNRFLFIAFVIIAACSAPADQFVKSSGGMEYKIISFKQADMVHPGETLKMHIKQVYKDSVLSDTRDSIPFYQPVDSTIMSSDSYAIFRQLRKGDSVIFKVLSDSAFKSKWPPFAKKGETLYTHLKIIDVLGVKENFREDLQREIQQKRKALGYQDF